MNVFLRSALRSALGLTLISGAATLLTACDYAANSPGVNTQYTHAFVNPPGYTNADINRDSVNNKQTVTTPIGKGSAIAIKNGTVNDQLNSAPAGKSAASSQTASGKIGPAEQNQPQSKGNGVGKDVNGMGGSGAGTVSGGAGTAASAGGSGQKTKGM